MSQKKNLYILPINLSRPREFNLVGMTMHKNM